MLKEGDYAPDFKAPDGEGDIHRLSLQKDKLVILYFYPKDDTPGCTTEACELTDDYSKFQKEGVVIFGVSPDSIESHKKFAAKYKIPYALLSDPDHKIAEEYGAWGEKQFMGKTYMGIIRSTFLIKKGKILKAFPKVTAKGHSKELLETIKGFELL